MIRTFFKNFFCEKKSFEQSIQLLAKHLSVFWAATTKNVDFFLILFSEKKNTSHFEIAPKKFFVIFFQPQIDFRIQTNIF